MSAAESWIAAEDGGRHDRPTPKAKSLINVVLGAVARIAANRAQAPSHAAFGFGPVDPFQGHLHEQWNCREGPDRDKSDRRSLPRRAIEMLSHEQTDPEPKGGPGQGQQSKGSASAVFGMDNEIDIA